MLRLNRLAFLLLACCFHFFSKAQTTGCSAAFSYSAGNNKVTNFFSLDSLGATHRWSFGDGTAVVITANSMVTHQFAQPGKYEVIHRIEKPNANCRDSAVKIITIDWRDSCHAGFEWQAAATIPPGSSPFTYQFTNTSQSFSDIKSFKWAFGDGTSSADKNPIHTYLQTGSYQVCLRIETKSGCISELCKQLVIKSDSCNLLAKYEWKKDSLECKKIRFINHSYPVSSNVHFIWKFGDGTDSRDINPSHVYTQPGKYYVCLVSEAVPNCRAVYCDSVIVNCETPCNITATYEYRKDSIDCKKIYFKNLSASSSNTHFIWKFGDGTESRDISPSHVYTQPGKYYVCLVSEAIPNCRAAYCDSVIVNCENSCVTSARFEWKKDSADCKKIRFINLSAPITPNTHFAWKFGDGNGSYDTNPSHTYQQPGKYMVCLVVDAGNNCTRYYCDSVIVSCGDSCNMQPAFNWKTDEAIPGRIYFKNLTVSPSAAIHYVWKFGDNSSSNDANPVHVYSHPGKYNVCLIAEMGSACRKEVCQEIEIKSCDLIARFETQHDSSRWNTLHFNNVSKPVSTIWQTYWSYGDGGSSRDYNSFHSYDKPGVYPVCLKVISLGGCSSYYCDTIRIVKTDSCEAKGGFKHYSSAASSLSIKFEALYQNNTAGYYWNFGDSTAGAGRLSFHSYTKPGKYHVCLTVKDDQCSVTHCEEMIIEKPANEGGRLAVFPNPAVNTVSLDLAMDRPGQVSIRFLDGSGAVKSEFGKNGVAGTNRFVLPVEKLSQGIYMVEIKANSGIWFSRFVKGQ